MEFEKEVQRIVDNFKARLKSEADKVIGELYTDIIPYAETDAVTNFRQSFRDEITQEFQKEISSEHGHYSWAHHMRMNLLKHHKEELQNTIIKDLQEKIESQDERMEQMRIWR